jgi:hypothetical protein
MASMSSTVLAEPVSRRTAVIWTPIPRSMTVTGTKSNPPLRVSCTIDPYSDPQSLQDEEARPLRMDETEITRRVRAVKLPVPAVRRISVCATFEHRNVIDDSLAFLHVRVQHLDDEPLLRVDFSNI